MAFEYCSFCNSRSIRFQKLTTDHAAILSGQVYWAAIKCCSFDVLCLGYIYHFIVFPMLLLSFKKIAEYLSMNDPGSLLQWIPVASRMRAIGLLNPCSVFTKSIVNNYINFSDVESVGWSELENPNLHRQCCWQRDFSQGKRQTYRQQSHRFRTFA